VTSPLRILGLDPGLRHTGWGIISVQAYAIRPVACGVISAPADLPLPERLAQIFHALIEVIQEHKPEDAAIEETFANKNAASTLKLGFARGVVMVAPAHMGLKVSEYTANQVKKAVVGQGHADKEQVQAMVKMILPGIDFKKADAADALAIAICHAHHQSTMRQWSKAL
jgi:crossover junction endodeoxyribonuclease RuvC